jgi:methyl-accepting chemotaxis protein
MENVKTASAQNAEGAKQMETATHNISELGSKLKELVSWYRIAV